MLTNQASFLENAPTTSLINTISFSFSFFKFKPQKKSGAKKIPIQRSPGAITNSAAKSMQRSPVSAMNDYATVGRRLPQSGNGATGSEVSCISVSPDSTIIAVAWRNATVALHDIPNNSFWYLSQGPSDRSYYPRVVFSPTGKYIASSDHAQHIACRLWTAATGQPRWKVTSDVETASISFSPDSSNVAWAGNEAIHICNVSTGQEIYKFRGHEDWIQGLHYTPAGDFLISVPQDASIRILATSGPSNQQQHRIWQEESTAKRCAALSPDGATLASGDMKNKIILWDIKSGEWLTRPYEAHSGEFTKLSLAFSADGLHIASTSQDQSEGIHIREVKSGKVISKINGFYRLLRYSPDGKYIVSQDVKDGCPTILKLNRIAAPLSPNPPVGLSAVDESGSREHGGPDEEINKAPEKDTFSSVHESKPKGSSF